MKKEVIVLFVFLFIILVLLPSFISAGFFSDIWNRIIGKATSTCTDTDNGLDYFVKGRVCDSSNCYDDFCVNASDLFEIYCGVQGKAAGSRYSCPRRCSNGACIPEITCTIYYYDSDNDGYGAADSRCLTSPSGSYTATSSGDCDDTNSEIYPGATEICDGLDNDCDGSIDEGCPGVVDVNLPTINIIYPIERVYNSHITTLKYTASDDVALDSCSYSLDKGVTKVTVTCNQDITKITSIEGSNTWIVYAKDTLGNENSKSVTFTIDLTAIIQTCEDGTLYNECSTTKPLYCDSSGNLIDNYCYGPDLIVDTADDCGCPLDKQCQTDGSCSVVLEVDSDGDGIPDIHDPDTDGDGILDISYSFIDPSGDMDSDGILNINDDDIDGDGILNGFELEFQSLGFIVELEDEPLIVQKAQLEEKADNNEGNMLVQVMGNTLPKKIAPTTRSNLEGKMGIKRKDLENQRENIKEKIKDELKKDSIVTGSAVSENENDLVVMNEYENVFNGLALDVTPKEAEEIKQMSGVKEVYPNFFMNITLIQSVPLINADDVWKSNKDLNPCSGDDCLTGKGITIGIIDTGVDYTHPDLGGCTKEQFLNKQCSKVIGGYDFVNNDNNPMDDYGHGTHVAGIAAGNGKIKGVAPDAKIYAYKVLDSRGSGISSDIIAAIERSVDPNKDGNTQDHLDIISLSIGADCTVIGDRYYIKLYTRFCGPDDPTSKAIDNVVRLGVVAIISAGNSGPEKGTIGSPGTARSAITVGATNKNDVIADFSSRGPVFVDYLLKKDVYLNKPDVVAPGVNIYSTIIGSYASRSGTSMATPHVAGAVALIKQAHPDWTPKKIKEILMDNAIDLGYDLNTQGYGRIDLSFIAPKSVSPPISEDISKKCVSNVGQSCDDGNPCTTGETIQCDGTCGGGSLVAKGINCEGDYKACDSTGKCEGWSGTGCDSCPFIGSGSYSCTGDAATCKYCILKTNQGRYYTGKVWSQWSYSEKSAVCRKRYCKTRIIVCLKWKTNNYNWQIKP